MRGLGVTPSSNNEILWLWIPGLRLRLPGMTAQLWPARPYLALCCFYPSAALQQPNLSVD